MTNIQPLLIGGKTIETWERLWREVDGGLKHHQRQLRYKVGLYRFTLKGQIMAIGVGTERVAGLAKRLSDFRRPGKSGRSHHAGELIYENRDRLEVEVLVTGSDLHAQDIAKKLKAAMLELHRPAWSHPNSPFMRKG
jgi:hypothetical protein